MFYLPKFGSDDPVCTYSSKSTYNSLMINKPDVPLNLSEHFPPPPHLGEAFPPEKTSPSDVYGKAHLRSLGACLPVVSSLRW